MDISLSQDTVDNLVSAIDKIERALDPSIPVIDVPRMTFDELHDLRYLRRMLSMLTYGKGEEVEKEMEGDR